MGNIGTYFPKIFMIDIEIFPKLETLWFLNIVPSMIDGQPSQMSCKLQVHDFMSSGQPASQLARQPSGKK